MNPKSEQSLLVAEGMREYWRKPGVRERRAIQAKIREREAQLARLERHGMVNTDRFRHIESKLEQLNEQLEQLRK
jgi:argininosuccinate lyase